MKGAQNSKKSKRYQAHTQPVRGDCHAHIALSVQLVEQYLEHREDTRLLPLTRVQNTLCEKPLLLHQCMLQVLGRGLGTRLSKFCMLDKSHCVPKKHRVILLTYLPPPLSPLFLSLQPVYLASNSFVSRGSPLLSLTIICHVHTRLHTHPVNIKLQIRKTVLILKTNFYATDTAV